MLDGKLVDPAWKASASVFEIEIPSHAAGHEILQEGCRKPTAPGQYRAEPEPIDRGARDSDDLARKGRYRDDSLYRNEYGYRRVTKAGSKGLRPADGVEPNDEKSAQSDQKKNQAQAARAGGAAPGADRSPVSILFSMEFDGRPRGPLILALSPELPPVGVGALSFRVNCLREALMAEYFSYAQKAAHYFKRPHEAAARTPIETPAAWCGPELADRDAWRAVLSASQRRRRGLVDLRSGAEGNG